MVVLLIFFVLGLFLLVSFGMIVKVANKSSYTSSIEKKFNSMGYKVVSINSIEGPDFLKKKEKSTNFVMDFGGSPILYIYKWVELEDQNFTPKKSIVVIKKVLFAITSIKYYLDFKNNGVYNLLE